MNKHEKALEQIKFSLKQMCLVRLENPNYNKKDMTWDFEGITYSRPDMISIRDIQELVERATPKKVNSIDVYVKCPNCSNDEIRDIDNYCPNCGQALDWS